MRYEDIVFLQGEEAEEMLDLIRDSGERHALHHLSEIYDYGEAPVREGEAPWGGTDYVHREIDCRLPDYAMSYNLGLGYVGLIKILKED